MAGSYFCCDGSQLRSYNGCPQIAPRPSGGNRSRGRDLNRHYPRVWTAPSLASCLLDGSWALDPLNSFAVAGPVTSAHDAAAAQGYGGLYALVWGEPVLPERSTAIWLTRPRGIQWRLVLDTVRQQFPQTTLWRRQMVLGPGKEFGLIAPPGVEIAAPSGWSALAVERVPATATSTVGTGPIP